MQFSLRTLLLVVTCVAIVCSLMSWLRETGIEIAMLSLGIGLLSVGIWRKRKIHVLVGCGLIVALIISLPWLLTAVCWVGHKTISVTIRVQDPSGTAIPNATVQPIDRSSGSTTATTNSEGIAMVQGSFQICGKDTLLSKSGIVELLGERLNVRAIGFRSFDRELDEIVEKGYWDLRSPSPPEVLIQLERDEKVQSPTAPSAAKGVGLGRIRVGLVVLDHSLLVLG